MPKIAVCSHNVKSHALKELAAALTKRLGYRVYRVTPERLRGRIPVMFYRGIDKVSQFRAFTKAGISCPAFATTLDGARELPSKSVVVRELIDSSEGHGITICVKDEVSIHAPLYTEYIPKKKEYRVHVWDSKVIDVQEKRRKNGAEGNTQIRNTANGYVFCRDGVAVSKELLDLGTSAVAALDRTNGAVDIIYNEHRGKCYVLEVNSRPGMCGTTVEKYADAIVGKL